MNNESSSGQKPASETITVENQDKTDDAVSILFYILLHNDRVSRFDLTLYYFDKNVIYVSVIFVFIAFANI